MPNPTKLLICCANHDHATDPTCEYGAKELIVELTEEEIAAQATEEAARLQNVANRIAAQEALAALKASAKAKLIAGTPLTEEEAATIVL